MNFTDPKTLVFLGVGFLFVLTLLMRVARDLSYARWIVAAMVFFSALATTADKIGATFSNNVWIKPLQNLRAEGYAAFAVLLMIAAMFHPHRLTTRGLPAQGWALMTVNLYAGVLEIIKTDPRTGIERLILVVVSMIAMQITLPAILQTSEDFLKLLRALGATGVAWASVVIVQVPLGYGELVMPRTNRFIGLLGNPQGTAVYLAPQIMILVFLVLNETERRLKLLWTASAAFMIILMAWTGSRTGGIMTIFGLMSVLYTRLGKGVFFAPIIAAGFYGLVLLAEALGIDLPLDRFTSATDTRTEVWKLLLDDAINAPLLGTGYVGARAVENSYLLGSVVFGPGMFLLLMVLMFTTCIQVLKLRLVRKNLPPLEQRVADMIAGYVAMYFAGAFFEWYILARLDPNHPFFMVFACLCGSLIHRARDREAYGAEPGVVYDEEYERLAATYGEGS